MRLGRYDAVMVNTSGGKDSQTSLRFVVNMAREEGFPLDRITVAHADLDFVEWPGARQLAEKQAGLHGVRFRVEKYRNKHKANPTLLQYIRARGKWPSSTTRYCTSEFKRSPCGRVLTEIHRGLGGKTKILNVFGFRAEESPARRKRKQLASNKRFSTKSREVWDWLPVHAWKEQEVWDDIHASEIPHHFAYDLGMPRLSCRFCVFAPKAALMIAGKQYPELLQTYVDLEKEMGHDFKHGEPIREVLEALQAGDTVDTSGLTGEWNM